MLRRIPLTLVCLMWLASNAFAGQLCSISLAITSPNTPGTKVGNVLSLQWGVTSVCQLQSAVASVPGLTTSILGTSNPQIPMTTVPFGPFTLTVTATDVFGTTATRSVSLIHDAPPILTVTSPANDDIARPLLHFTARCQDDDPAGCDWIRVVFVQPASGVELARVQSSLLDQDVAFTFQARNITIQARDRGGQITEVTRRIYVEPSPRLVEDSRAPGLVVDDSPTRSLFTDDAGQVCLFDKATGATTVLLGGQPYDNVYGLITPTGAVFDATPTTGTSRLRHVYEWRAGSLVVLGTGGLYNVAGNFVVWVGSDSASIGNGLFLRDLTTEITTAIEPDLVTSADVAANGDVVYGLTTSQIWRYRAGVKTALTAPSSVYVAYGPRTDGVNVAYRRYVGATGVSQSTWLITPSTEISLDPSPATLAANDYRVAGGWTAFTRRATDGSRNLWTRAPDGTEQQRTFYGDTVAIKALNTDGRVAYQRGGRTYFVAPGRAPVDVGNAWQDVFWRDGNLYLVVGRSVMRVDYQTPTGSTVDFDGDRQADMLRFGVDGTWRITTSGSSFSTSTSMVLGDANAVPVIGDFDGDGRQDPAVYNAGTGTWTALTSSSNYTTRFTVQWGGPTYLAVPGDYDGDGKTDPAVYQRTTGYWFILKSSSNYLASIAINWGGPGYTAVGNQDFDGDGKTDLAVYRRATGMWYVLQSSTNYTTNLAVALGGPGQTLVPGDYDGDRKADFAVYDRRAGTWQALTSSSGYTTAIDVSWGGLGGVPAPADYDGDGRIDPAMFFPSTGLWRVLESSSHYTSSFTVAGLLGVGAPVSSAVAPAASDTLRGTDVDGDSASDITVYNASAGVFYTLTSTANYGDAINTRWGGAAYSPVSGDFDGDSVADRAVYEEATGWWFVLTSSSNFTSSLARNLGGPGWRPVPGDYDGDGKTDFVAYNAAMGQWYGLLSGANYTTTLNVTLGGSGYTPVPGDYDGDGRTDVAVYANATGIWTVRTAAANFASGFTRSVGGTGYVPVAGDYDGDGTDDVVVYNTSTGLWYGLKSSTNYATTVNVKWGGSDYVPVRGDFDGDGRVDVAVYNPSTGDWFVLLSGTNNTASLTKNWGGVGYAAVPQVP